MSFWTMERERKRETPKAGRNFAATFISRHDFMMFHVHPAVRLEHLSGMPNPQTWWAGHCLDSVSGNDRQERSE